MKNFWKKMSWLGLSMALTMPIGALLACSGGGDKESKYVFPMPDIKGAEALKFDDVDLSAFKAAAIAKGITKAQVDSITLEEIQKYRLKQDISADKKTLIKKLDDLLLSFSFEKNLDANVMGEFQKWLNNASLQVYNVQDATGPWRSQESQGAISYHRNDLINIRRASKLSGGSIDLVGSKFIENSGFNPKRFVKIFGAARKPKKGDREFDLSLAILNHYSGFMGVGTSFAFYRTQASGNYTYEIDPNTGIKNWKTVVQEKTNLYNGLKIKINGNTPTDPTYAKAVELAETQPKQTEVIFENNAAKPVKYAKSENGNVVETDVTFKAKDLFYGFARNLYASKEVRNEGKINGVDIKAYLNAFTDDQKTQWINLFENKDAADAYDNGNTYLFDLYGIDILETLKANVATTDENKFIVKFKGFAPTSLEFFRDSNTITPFSKTLLANNIKTQPQINSFDPVKLSIFSYGNPYKGSGEISPDGFLSITPFIYTNYSITPTENITIKQNPAYVDQDWVNDPLSIKGFTQEINKENIVASAHAQARLNAFKDAKNTEEYLLDSSILNMKSLLKKVEKYKVYVKPNRRGEFAASTSWNFYGFEHTSYNDLGRKMMWGLDKNIATTPSALKEFFYGSGAKTRSSINAAINWYAMAQTLYPGLNKEFYPAISLDDEFVTSKVDKKLAFPSHMQTTGELKNIYESNIQDLYKAWTPGTVASAAKTLDDVATKVGATENNPAQIGILRHLYKDKPKTPQQIQTSEIILGRLNSLTKKVKFVNQDDKYYKWGEFYKIARRKKTHATLLHYYGPDYLGLGSINQQYLTYYNTFGVVPFFKAAFDES